MGKKHKRHSRIERTAYHEAGHTVMAYLLRRRFKYVTIDPKVAKDSYGCMRSGERPKKSWLKMETGNQAQHLIEKEVKVFLAGLVAEWVLTKHYNYRGAKGDIKKSFELLYTILGDEEYVNAYMDYLRFWVRAELRGPLQWPLVVTVAKALLKHQTLTYRKIRAIIKKTKESWQRY